MYSVNRVFRRSYVALVSKVVASWSMNRGVDARTSIFADSGGGGGTRGCARRVRRPGRLVNLAGGAVEADSKPPEGYTALLTAVNYTLC